MSMRGDARHLVPRWLNTSLGITRTFLPGRRRLQQLFLLWRRPCVCGVVLQEWSEDGVAGLFVVPFSIRQDA
jgi:hypothetical protein